MAPRGMTPERAERANKVMTMRRDSIPFREIADTLGISVSTAHDDYRAAIRDVYRGNTEELIHTQHQRLEHLYSVYIQLANDGDHKAADVCLKVNDQVAKLFGLNGVIKLEVQGGAAEKFAELLTAVRGDEPEGEG